jgi:signal transduction histidine kinase
MTFLRKFFGSFRTKLMVLVLLPAIPAFALAMQRNFDQRKSEKNQVVHEISAISRLIAANELSYVRNARQILATLSGIDFLVQSTDSSFSAVHFQNLLKLSPDYHNFGLIESNGQVFASGVMPPDGTRSLADRAYFQRTQAGRGFSIGNFQAGRLTEKRSLSFGFPVVNRAGDMNRVIFASLKVERLNEAIQGVALPEAGVATVFDSGGNILARFPDDGGWIGKTVSDTQLVREVLRAGDGVIHSVGLDGVKRVYAVTSIADDISDQLYVTVGIPTEVLFANANRALRRNVLIMIATIAVALFIASFFAQRTLIQPVSDLSAAAHQLASGDLSARSHIAGSTLEIRKLSEAFDSMAVNLQERETEVRKAHDEISRINSQLEQRVSDRTAELTAVNQELEAFSYSVSHDLRAPLRHMDGFAELLKRNHHERLDDKGRRHLQVISDAARKMGTLIDDLLVFSKMGRQQMLKTKVEMNALVRECQSQLEPDAANRRIEWEIARLPEVDGDAALLRQVWLNLGSNAIKYTRTRETARITIGFEENPLEYSFFVRDNGVGFDMRYADKLFGVFQRLHRDDEFEGTGIGLANVRRIIARHGGKTWAESISGEGSTFHFTLPKNG